MQVGVIGGGINGVCVAWRLAQEGHEVALLERDDLIGATSSASSKLLHGGLRYLEHGQIALVREGLRERAWWLANAPGLTERLRLLLPIYTHSRRPRWQIKVGLWGYDRLAGRANIGRHCWLARDDLRGQFPQLNAEHLRGAYAFYDGRMDDRALGLWVAEQARAAGVTLHSRCPVDRVDVNGAVWCGDGKILKFDRVVNVAGPWAEQLLDVSGVGHRYRLDLVRGSHIVIDRPQTCGWALAHPRDGRVAFVLPWQGRTLVGTTEVRQTLADPIACADAERDYLLQLYNAHFSDYQTDANIVTTFAGLRPLVASGRAVSSASREYAIERQGRLTTVWGGKWTTARALAQEVARVIVRE